MSDPQLLRKTDDALSSWPFNEQQGAACPPSHLTLGVPNFSPSQIEIIHRATQLSRDLGEAFVYIPHRKGGKLNVLKGEVIKQVRVERGEQDPAKPNTTCDRGSRVMSFDFFLKMEKARWAAWKACVIHRRTTTKHGKSGSGTCQCVADTQVLARSRSTGGIIIDS